MEKSILKLEASAGSGKTYRLALEYLSRLLRAFAAREVVRSDAKRQRELLGSILAITFTVKAAREMKERIIRHLKLFALREKGRELNAGEREFLRRLAADCGLSQRRICELSGVLIELVLSSYDDFNVTTIDSLMSAMVKAVSPDLELPADYEIAVGAGPEMAVRGRAMMAALADQEWERLRLFLQDWRRMNPRVAWRVDDAIVERVSALFRRTLRETEAAVPSGTDLQQRLAASWSGFREALGPLLPLLQEREPGAKGRRYASGQYLKGALLDCLTAIAAGDDDFSRLEELIRSTYFRKEDPRELLIQDTPDGQCERFCAAYRSAQKALRRAVLDFSACRTRPYREFLGNFIAAWEKGKRVLFVEEFSRVLAALFDRWSAEAFPYLYLKLSDRFKSFLFDEFQDTSTLQFKALAPLIDEVLSRERSGSLFIVGDRKQAIYRWRGGNSELMEAARLREQVPAIDHLAGKDFADTLGTNWRSLRELVRFNNDFWEPGVISQVAAEPELQQSIRDNFQGSRQELPPGRDREGGYVELDRVGGEDERGAEAEAEPAEDDDGALGAPQLDRVEGIIRRLHEEYGYAYSDIAVLVRKNDQVRAVVRRLGRRGIDNVSDQSLMLGANARVAEIIAFLRFLDYPPDNLNFFAFATGAICGAAMAARCPEEARAFSEEVFIGCPGPFYKRFQERFPVCWQGLVEPFFQSVGFLPPYDLFSDLTQVFRLYEDFSGDTPFFLALGDALHRAERDGGGSIAGFLRQWQAMVDEEATPSVTIPESTPGVRVLTMHQSKGLEFPAVIVPVDDSGGRGDDPLHWDREGLFYINGDFAQAHPGLRARYERENIRGSIDLLNLLYVAFTRAREALFVPVAVGRGVTPPEAAPPALVRRISRGSDAIGRHPLLRWFAGGAPAPFQRGCLARRSTATPPGRRPVPIPSKKTLTRSWQSRYLVFRRSEPGERRGRTEAKRGERVHELLARLGALSDPGRLAARVRELAAASGWPESDAEPLAAFLSRADVFALLSRGMEVHLEKEIVGRDGAVPEFRRLDRLQISDDEVLVIDFKTGREKAAGHLPQVKGYLDAVGPLFPGRRCRGFLLYVDRGEIEEVRCSR